MEIVKMKVIPAPGLIVRDPVTRLALPPGVSEVPKNAYWLRRMAKGDVTAPVVSKKKEG
jgi:hypothetical protein